MSENSTKPEVKIYCEACGDSGDPCQECCEHNEHDHFICLDCEKELDPGKFIDAAEYDMER